jgi:hypothetical protein
MVESVITLLIYICVLVALAWLVIWVVTEILGLPIPPRVVQIIWVIVALVVILLVYRAVAPHLGLHLP